MESERFADRAVRLMKVEAIVVVIISINIIMIGSARMFVLSELAPLIEKLYL